MRQVIDGAIKLFENHNNFILNCFQDKDHEMSWIQPLTSTLNQVLRCRLGKDLISDCVLLKHLHKSFVFLYILFCCVHFCQIIIG